MLFQKMPQVGSGGGEISEPTELHAINLINSTNKSIDYTVTATFSGNTRFRYAKHSESCTTKIYLNDTLIVNDSRNIDGIWVEFPFEQKKGDKIRVVQNSNASSGYIVVSDLLY